MRKIATIYGAGAIAIAISLAASSAQAAPWGAPGKISSNAASIHTVSTGYMKGYFDSETRYDVDSQERGYQGGTETVHCSYRNEPKRVCKATGNGREICRITGWTLIESCN